MQSILFTFLIGIGSDELQSGCDPGFDTGLHSRDEIYDVVALHLLTIVLHIPQFRGHPIFTSLLFGDSLRANILF